MKTGHIFGVYIIQHAIPIHITVVFRSIGIKIMGNIIYRSKSFFIGLSYEIE